MRNHILILFSSPTYHKMKSMFWEAKAFDQTLAFNTAEVTDVRVYLFWVQLHKERPDSDFSLFPIQLIIRWTTCLVMQRPSISNYLHSIPLRLQLWEVFVWSPLQWETRSWFSISCQTYHQMNQMFLNAEAFNQPLSSFDTAEVTDVSVWYLCGVQPQWVTRFWFPIPYPTYY